MLSTSSTHLKAPTSVGPTASPSGTTPRHVSVDTRMKGVPDRSATVICNGGCGAAVLVRSRGTAKHLHGLQAANLGGRVVASSIPNGLDLVLEAKLAP